MWRDRSLRTITEKNKGAKPDVPGWKLGKTQLSQLREAKDLMELIELLLSDGPMTERRRNNVRQVIEMIRERIPKPDALATVEPFSLVRYGEAKTSIDNATAILGKVTTTDMLYEQPRRCSHLLGRSARLLELAANRLACVHTEVEDR